MTGKNLHAPVDENRVDISALPSGLYCLLLQNKYGVTTAKFVKE
jgi:hypothetical protein